MSKVIPTKTQEALHRAIAERDQAIAQLARAEESFQSFLESVSEGVVAVDATGKIALVNARTEAMFGYNREELLGQTVELLLPDHLAAVAAVHEKHRNGFISEPRSRPMGLGLELFGRRKDGSEFPVEVGLGALKSGLEHLSIGFVTDITERRLAEEKLRKSQSHLATAQAGAHMGSFELCLDGSEEDYWSRETYRILGFEPSQPPISPKEGIQRLVHPEDAALVRQAMERSITEAVPFDQVFRIATEDGVLKDTHCVMQPIVAGDGKVVKLVGTIQDISQQRKTEESLAQLASIVESSIDAIISKNMDAIIVSWNKAAERIYGYSSQEAIGSHITLLGPPDAPNEILEVLDAAVGGASVNQHEMVHRRKDGKRIHVSLTCSPVRDAAGRMSAVSLISRDITQRKEDESAARQQELRLLQSEKMASLGILVSGVAHEINTPNNYISLNAKIVSRVWNDVEPILKEYYEVNGDFLLAQMPYSQTKEKIDRLVSGISEGADRIQKIVQALKNFARKDTGDLNQTVDVNSVIRTSLVIMNSFIKQSTDFFSVEYGQNVFPVHGNAQQLEQVIINLITNACEALPGKEKKITVSTRLFTKTNKIVIEVQDEGMGISSEDLQFIFDPFFTTKRARGGIGLGLSTSHTIVRNHGGEFLFQSKPGKGTTARVILPVKPSHAIRH